MVYYGIMVSGNMAREVVDHLSYKMTSLSGKLPIYIECVRRTVYFRLGLKVLSFSVLSIFDSVL